MNEFGGSHRHLLRERTTMKKAMCLWLCGKQEDENARAEKILYKYKQTYGVGEE